MSKFAAWAHGAPSDLGIRLQFFEVTSQQRRQYLGFGDLETFFTGHEVGVSSTVSFRPGFDAKNIIDQNQKTAWSSVGHSSENHAEWFAFWFSKQRVNFLELTPRRVGGKANGFPQKIQIHYSAGPNDWRLVREVALNNPEDGSDGVLISLDKTVDTDGLLVTATKLRTDDFNNYHFQMAGARAGHRTLTFSETAAKNAALQLPSSLFFFGDEPDLLLPADEYARVYERFVEAIKSGSTSAKVSPAGFTFANSIHGSVLTDYAQKFLDACHAPVDELRFHYFSGDPDSYANVYAPLAAWADQHGSKRLVLGSFGMIGVSGGDDVTAALMKQMHGIKGDDRIVEAVHWSYNFGGNHRLLNVDDTALSADGRTYLANM
ncbi:discoidin domain-containing protein [Gemmata sp.]|uniref:discoidin domain-containing protein n=1 Tax=Gemmata sp. TaxID=1914242 RepID=UPI003F718346